MVKFGLSGKQVTVATLLAFGESQKHAAEAVKITPGTISVWKRDPAFKAKINEIQLNAILDTQSKFRSLALPAAKVLEEILENSTSEKMKLDAAKYILSTIQVAPSDGAFWMAGPTTAEEVEKQENEKVNLQRIKELGEELKLPFF